MDVNKNVLIAVGIIVFVLVLDAILYYTIVPRAKLIDAGTSVRVSSPIGIFSKKYPTPPIGLVGVKVGVYEIQNRNGNIVLTKDNEFIKSIN